jgi:threo-3-hydroxy-L-aspartate ammonia-lyase
MTVFPSDAYADIDLDLDAAHIRCAATVLDKVAVRTQVLTSAALDSVAGVSVLCKAENLQYTNSFKFRGAYTHLHALSSDIQAGGVIAASSGNHAHGVAAAARLLGIQATVVIPDDIPTVKADAITRHGARIVHYRRGHDDRDIITTDLARTHHLSVVPSADSLYVMAGAGTVALELLGDVPDLDVLLVPVGGGGLAAGCATIAKAHRAGLRVIGVEPATGNDTQLSLRAGQLRRIRPPSTIADGLTHISPTSGPFQINRRLLDDIVTVTDDEITYAMAAALKHLRVLVEPSGAVALAAALTGCVHNRCARMGVVLSGGNLDWTVVRAMINGRKNGELSRVPTLGATGHASPA